MEGGRIGSSFSALLMLLHEIAFPVTRLPNHYTRLWTGLVAKVEMRLLHPCRCFATQGKKGCLTYYKYNSSYCLCGGRVDLQKRGCKLNTTAFLIVFLILLFFSYLLFRLPYSFSTSMSMWYMVSLYVQETLTGLHAVFHSMYCAGTALQNPLSPLYSVVDLLMCSSCLRGISRHPVTEERRHA